jgi:hypothetical protein
MLRPGLIILASYASTIASLDAILSSAAPVMVDILSASASPQDTLAIQVCSGLINRPSVAGVGAYVVMHAEDNMWATELLPVPLPPLTPAAEFLSACLAPSSGAAGGRWISYNFSAQQALIPALITLAAQLDAVPLERGSAFIPATPPIFDAVAEWDSLSVLTVTAQLFARYANTTSTMAKMNPGYDVHTAPLDPVLNGLPDFSLVDYIVSAKLFNFWLLNGCIPGSAENALLNAMARPGATRWPQPIPVMGYDDSWAIAGDIFEAETTCFGARNAGQIATVGVNNLAYFSRAPPASPPRSAPRAPVVFNASKTYVALVVGDGDNIAFLKSSRAAWMLNRTRRCSEDPASCFPLLWTLSPHLNRLAPAIAAWFFEKAASTAGADAFALPPSGHLYAYPALMADADARAFVAATEADAIALNTSASVEWEFVGTWANAIKEYHPRFAANGIVSALFAVNVPYLAPIIDFGPEEFFKVFDNRTVLFRPQEWRGTSGAADPLLQPFLVSAQEMAARLSALPRGTVTQIYLTSDGGAQLEDLFDMVAALEPHVQVVGLDVAALAIASKTK